MAQEKRPSCRRCLYPLAEVAQFGEPVADLVADHLVLCCLHIDADLDCEWLLRYTQRTQMAPTQTIGVNTLGFWGHQSTSQANQPLDDRLTYGFILTIHDWFYSHQRYHQTMVMY